ncbi:MAG TPA: MFS transporter [Hyphomicrobiaceae bacterium]|nr:MFS transporter [Hyphomicrobiaceae bacterium]
MRGRWSILAILFVVRATMAVQFQSVASVAPLLSRDFGVGLADVGLLIGLYFAPGVALALPGGAIGHKFGDKATVCAGLVLMLSGGLMMAFLPSWSGQIAGRLVAGTGGVLLNVLMTKMVADWFAGREISTAMAIFVNSWPVGIAASLLMLPPIGADHGVSAAYVAVTALIAAGAVLLVAIYEPPATPAAGPTARIRLDRHTALAVIAAGLIWALYNIGFAMIFSFGPSMLVERGWSMTEAGSTTSIVLWLSAISVPFGGFLADRSKRHDLVLVMCCIVFAMLLLLVPRGPAIVPAIVALGLVCGLAAGPIMSLPAIVLEPATRAFGMGLFYATFYLGMMIGPVLGGKYATWAGTAAAAFDFGAATLLACPIVLWGFHRLARVVAPPALSST